MVTSTNTAIQEPLGHIPLETPSNIPEEYLLLLAKNYLVCRHLNCMDISGYANKPELFYLIIAN